MRYADDMVELSKSKRSGGTAVRKQQLKMNTEKSKVTSVFAQKSFKFLGFCMGKNGSGVYIRVHRKSLKKAKEKLKLLTKCNRGWNFRAVMREVKKFIRG